MEFERREITYESEQTEDRGTKRCTSIFGFFIFRIYRAINSRRVTQSHKSVNGTENDDKEQILETQNKTKRRDRDRYEREIFQECVREQFKTLRKSECIYL